MTKKSINPKELVELLQKGLYKVLIMDVRSRSEFDACHMNLGLVLNDEKKQQLVDLMNLPAEFVRTVSWSILEVLKTNSVDDKSISLSCRLFAERNKYDYIVLFDRISRLETLTPESKLGMLKRALYEFDLESCKNEPIILQGGWKDWLVFYPVLVSSPGVTFSVEEKSSSIDKLFDFDYPEFGSDNKKMPVNGNVSQPVKLPPLVVQPSAQVVVNNNLAKFDDESSSEGEEEMVVSIEQTEIRQPPAVVSASESSSTIGINRVPIINRSNKPGSIFIFFNF